MLERITNVAHNTIKQFVSKNDAVADLTCGNGQDTLFLSTIAKKVYAFDIQEDAINTTLKHLKQNNISNVSVHRQSHVDVSNIITEKLVCVVYNLGYLPGGDESITTHGSTTIESIKNILPLMAYPGLISITVYTGHTVGYKESQLLEDFLKELPSKKYNVIRYSNLNKINSPYNIFIEKIGE